MSIRIGPWDPLQLSLNILNQLLKKGLLSYEDAVEILRDTLPKEMPEEEKTNKDSPCFI